MMSSHKRPQPTTAEQFQALGEAVSKLGDEVYKPLTRAMAKFGIATEPKPVWSRLWWVPPYMAFLMGVLCLLVGGAFVVIDGDSRSALIAGGIALANFGAAAFLIWGHRAGKAKS